MDIQVTWCTTRNHFITRWNINLVVINGLGFQGKTHDLGMTCRGTDGPMSIKYGYYLHWTVRGPYLRIETCGPIALARICVLR